MNVSCKARALQLRKVIVRQLHDLFKTPNVVTQASSHARSDSERLVDSGEIVIDRMNRNRRCVIFKLLTEPIRKLRHYQESARVDYPCNVGENEFSTSSIPIRRA